LEPIVTVCPLPALTLTVVPELFCKIRDRVGRPSPIAELVLSNTSSKRSLADGREYDPPVLKVIIPFDISATAMAPGTL
jgi:hypothetical protein